MSTINVQLLSGVNVNTREQNNRINHLFLLDRLHTSYAELFALTQDFVGRKDVNNKWIDFYAGGVGTTLQQLMAGHSEYNAYEAITARREAYLFESKIRSSAVGIASAMGYSAFRGTNVNLVLTIIPDQDVKILPYTIIGSVNNYDIVALEEISIKYGEQIDIKVGLGILMEETLTIQSSNTYYFRFTSDKVSENIQISINGVPADHSRDILDLLNDEFVVLSNTVGGVDAFYLNRYPPAGWGPGVMYRYSDYISPDYSWRSSFSYEKDQYCKNNTNYLFKCIQNGISHVTEPRWNIEIGETTLDGTIIWECVGIDAVQRYFKSITPGIAASDYSEPVWPIVIGEKVYEEHTSWICVDTYGVSRYPYDTGDTISLRYLELENVAYTNKDLKLNVGVIQTVSINNVYSDVESIESIQVNAPLFHETQKIIRGREDYRKLLKQLVPNLADTNCFDVSPAVVSVTYVRNHTTTTWSYNKLVNLNDLIMPSSPNNFIYKATTNGRTAGNLTGVSSEIEPTWNTEIGGITRDNEIVWETVSQSEVLISFGEWIAETIYEVDEYIFVPSLPTVLFKMIGVEKEPVWPTTIGEVVQDNDITWECSDTIFLDGFDASWYETEKEYAEGALVKPVNPTGYFYRCKVAGTSGIYEPIWPTVICETVTDGTIVWECYDLTSSPVYQKNVILDTLPTYRPFGVEPNLLEDPRLVNVTLDIDLVLTSIVDRVTLENDVDTLLKEYQLILGLGVTINDLENLLEQNLSYVQIARVKLTDTSKIKEWQPGLSVIPGDVVSPTIPNGFYYYCTLAIGGSSGYTAWEDRSYSGFQEPDWPEIAGEQVEDDYLVWEMIEPIPEGTPQEWQTNTIYIKGALVSPITPKNNLIAKLVDVKFREPVWPLVPGSSVRDNKVYWTCVDFNTTVVPLTWNEYYIFTRNINTTQR